jgi:lincosamide and streptogramin A transport system ATP-binding/permease protein
MGKYSYEGSIVSSAAFEYFPFAINGKSKNTIDIVAEIYPGYEPWKVCREMSLLQISEDVLQRPFNSLSGGEQTKFLMCILFCKENNFLLIDEPTNHLDCESRNVLAKYLNDKKRFILVSHDRYFLDSCVDHVLSINNSNIEMQKGNFSSWWKNKQYKDNFEISQNDKLKKDIKRLAKSAERMSKWSDIVEKTKYGTRNSGLRPDRGYVGHKSAKMMKRSKNAEKLKYKAMDEKSKLLKDIDNVEDLKLHPLIHHDTKLLEASNLSILYENKKIFGNLSFDVNQNERVAFAGRNGCGKTSLIKLILGEKIKYEGKFSISGNLEMSYVSQSTSHLKGSIKNYIDYNNLDESLFKAILRKLGFSRIQFEKDLQNFSEGQKKKICIAASLCRKANIYIWDEPLNYIDVISRIQIEELIVKYSPTMILVEHDKEFIENTECKVINIG